LHSSGNRRRGPRILPLVWNNYAYALIGMFMFNRRYYFSPLQKPVISADDKAANSES